MAQALAPYPSSSILWTLHDDDWARMRREVGLKPVPINKLCKVTIDEFHLLS